MNGWWFFGAYHLESKGFFKFASVVSELVVVLWDVYHYVPAHSFVGIAKCLSVGKIFGGVFYGNGRERTESHNLKFFSVATSLRCFVRTRVN